MESKTPKNKANGSAVGSIGTAHVGSQDLQGVLSSDEKPRLGTGTSMPAQFRIVSS
jgi:hypothetical protein